MDESKTVAMTAIAQHEFGGKTYVPGDTYDVAGDGSQTAEQYADTLIALRFAKRTPAKGKAGSPPLTDDTSSRHEYKTTELGETRKAVLTPPKPTK
jgi:hypothetical protein